MTDKRYWVIYHYEGDHTDIISEHDELIDAQIEFKRCLSLPKGEWDVGYEIWDTIEEDTIEWVEVWTNAIRKDLLLSLSDDEGIN